MALLNYTYLKLKMSRPKGVINMATSFQWAYQCKIECFELATTIITSTEELLVVKRVVAGDILDSNCSAKSFEPTKGIKEIQVNPKNPKQEVTYIGTTLSPK